MATGKIILGVLVGAAAGAIAGVLLAPDKGSVTRQKLFKLGEEYADGIKNTFNDYLNTVSDNVNTVKDKAKEAVDKTTAKVETAANTVKDNDAFAGPSSRRKY